jgi:hypothetical protein
MTLALVAAATFGSTLNAQSYQLSGTIPFAFHVGDKVYESGRYTISETAPTMVPSLMNNSTHHSTFVPGAVASRSGNRDRKLVFHCYNGTQCYLAEIWPGNQQGISIAMSKGEKQLVREGRREMAMIRVDLHVAD